MPNAIIYQDRREKLWEAIGRLVEACGGKWNHYIYGNTTRMNCVVEIEALASLDGSVPEDRRYLELLMAVGRRFPNESGHETALRYIREAEARASLGHHDSGASVERDLGLPNDFMGPVQDSPKTTP